MNKYGIACVELRESEFDTNDVSISMNVDGNSDYVITGLCLLIQAAANSANMSFRDMWHAVKHCYDDMRETNGGETKDRPFNVLTDITYDNLEK